MRCVSEVRMRAPFIASQRRLERSVIPTNRHWGAISAVREKHVSNGAERVLPNLAQKRQVASSISLFRRLVNFGPIHRVNSEFLAHSFISLILDIVRLIYRLIQCRFSSTLWLFTAKG